MRNSIAYIQIIRNRACYSIRTYWGASLRWNAMTRPQAELFQVSEGA